jgi:hypothetical protein
MIESLCWLSRPLKFRLRIVRRLSLHGLAFPLIFSGFLAMILSQEYEALGVRPVPSLTIVLF